MVVPDRRMAPTAPRSSSLSDQWRQRKAVARASLLSIRLLDPPWCPPLSLKATAAVTAADPDANADADPGPGAGSYSAAAGGERPRRRRRYMGRRGGVRVDEARRIGPARKNPGVSTFFSGTIGVVVGQVGPSEALAGCGGPPAGPRTRPRSPRRHQWQIAATKFGRLRSRSSGFARGRGEIAVRELHAEGAIARRGVQDHGVVPCLHGVVTNWASRAPASPAASVRRGSRRSHRPRRCRRR